MGVQLDKILEEKNDYRQSFVPNVLGTENEVIELDEMMEFEHDKIEQWTDIYKPKNLRQIIGNKTQIEKLKKWL